MTNIVSWVLKVFLKKIDKKSYIGWVRREDQPVRQHRPNNAAPQSCGAPPRSLVGTQRGLRGSALGPGLGLLMPLLLAQLPTHKGDRQATYY